MKHREQFSPTPGPQKSISRWFTGAGIATLTCSSWLPWQPLDKTVVRGGFGMFYESLNGLNYRNSVVSTVF